MTLLELEGVTVTNHSQHPLLDRVSVGLRAGELVVLAGRNGAGKTLLARCAAGLLEPDEGRVVRRGSPPGLVFQDTRSQVLGQTVEEDVALGPESAALSRREVRKRVSEALSKTGLTGLEHRDPITLSGGERRRLSVAALLALRPELLILDEPFSSLDFEGVRSVLSLVLDLHAAGTGLVVITHDLEKIVAHAERLILVDAGRIVADGPPSEIIEKSPDCGLRPPRVPTAEMSWLR